MTLHRTTGRHDMAGKGDLASCVALALLLAGGSAVSAAAPPTAALQTPAVAPQAAPAQELLRAVKLGDEEALRAVFSARMRREFEAMGWATVLKRYQEGFAQQLGDYELSEFTFAFDGGDDRGRVIVVRRGTPLPPLQVVREQGQWKLDER